MPIDEALEAYLASLDQAEDAFLDDVENLQEEGLSTEEILLFIAALDISSYFVEDLQLSAGINAYMAATDNILDNLTFFGKINNIDDTYYQRPDGYNQNGRTFTLGFKKVF